MIGADSILRPDTSPFTRSLSWTNPLHEGQIIASGSSPSNSPGIIKRIMRGDTHCLRARITPKLTFIDTLRNGMIHDDLMTLTLIATLTA